MIYDKKLMIADGLAFGGTPTTIDLGMANPGPGQPITIEVRGNGLVGASGLTITDGASSPATDTYIGFAASSAALNEGVRIMLTSDVQRYINVNLSGTPSAGSWTCGVILP